MSTTETVNLGLGKADSDRIGCYRPANTPRNRFRTVSETCKWWPKSFSDGEPPTGGGGAVPWRPVQTEHKTDKTHQITVMTTEK